MVQAGGVSFLFGRFLRWKRWVTMVS